MANKLNLEKRTQIVAMLVEGNSINSTCRVTGASKKYGSQTIGQK